MADGLLPGAGKKLARQALRAVCGGHSAYRDAKVSYRLRLQLQVRAVPSEKLSDTLTFAPWNVLAHQTWEDCEAAV